ncbi:NAD(P)-dependent oxidoreductase [Bradyrhizobium sp. NP1]|uniref:NAD(P)-dependent oxidoreductase n=1 Tax=Bradyrhizobium sp. NP1 TaxID=3049772 RepID=UPI0025A60E27|nr:NAD(P)-dependent oxidoreductase [Bradyrhizobium sp. NP1]WJR76865.1 NAD(P)-dependent oxidoreductase [Bradyrhizobium sp. NP1]
MKPGPVGMVGVGNIGLPILRNLLEGGYEVVAFRRTNRECIVSAGAVAAESCAEVSSRCEVIFTVLPGFDALRSVVFAVNGLVKNAREGQILVELSTLGIADKVAIRDELASRGTVMLDGAISATPNMVVAKRGAMFVSGGERECHNLLPILRAILPSVYYMGGFGNAQRIKLCANHLVSVNLSAAAECLALGRKLGIPSKNLVDALVNSGGGSVQLTARAQRMIDGEWSPAMGTNSGLKKDIDLIQEIAREIQCPVPLLTAAARMYGDAIEKGLGDADVASIYEVVSERAGVPPRRS